MSERQNFKIWVIDSHNKYHEISINENDSIATLKQNIKLKLSIGDDQVFEIMCNGELLDEKDKETSLANKISDYGIEGDSFINTVILPKQKLDFENNAGNNKIDNQIIKETKKEKKDENEGNKQIINTDNENKTNNEEDNENKDNKLNSKQNLNARELHESDYESSQNLDQKLKEDEKIIKDKENNKKIINTEIDTENEIKINNLSEVELNLDLDNKNGEINSRQNLNVSELNKNENNEKNLDLINNEICPKINYVQEDIPNKLEKISANETEKKTTDMNGTISSSVNVGSNVNALDKKANDKTKLNFINNETDYQIGNNTPKKISGEMKKIEEKQFTIAVKGSKNQSIYVSVDKDELITNLKSKIKKQLGIKDNENIELIHNESLLEDNGKISDYGIENNSVIIWTWPVLAKASSSNIKMHNKKNDNRKKDKKINWKLILLGLLFFVCAGLAWYLGAAWFLIGGLAFAGLVFFGLSFIWLKLKSCIGCTKIDILKKQENKSPVKNSLDLGDIPRESDNTLSQAKSKK